jgi:hypothetical protein
MRGGCLGRLRRAERRIVGVPGGAVTIERVGVGLVQWRPGLQARREVGIGERPLADRHHIGPARLDIGAQRFERALGAQQDQGLRPELPEVGQQRLVPEVEQVEVGEADLVQFGDQMTGATVRAALASSGFGLRFRGSLRRSAWFGRGGSHSAAARISFHAFGVTA